MCWSTLTRDFQSSVEHGFERDRHKARIPVKGLELEPRQEVVRGCPGKGGTERR